MNELRNNRRGKRGVKGHLSVNFAKIPSGLFLCISVVLIMKLKLCSILLPFGWKMVADYIFNSNEGVVGRGQM